MSDPPSPDRRSNGGSAFSELRNLLLGPEQAQIDELQRKLESSHLDPNEVGKVLPEAIDNRSRKDNQLTRSLLPSVEQAIHISVKKNPGVLVDALFPVMGPAIRKAISAAINNMIQSLNQTLEYSVSIRGLKWRWESIRTGRSFAEVVLLHSLRYRVEQVFLIHRPGGLLLNHVIAGSSKTQDPDMVSGMLTAIQDFVRDSFGVQESEALDYIHVGDFTVWVEQGPHAILAGVIRGTAPQELRLVFQEAIERIHAECEEDLEAFDGDSSPFEKTTPLLESCLLVQYHPSNRKTSPVLRIIVAALLISAGFYGFITVRNMLRWNTYKEKLTFEPGILMTQSGKRGGKFFVSGLRDPFASDPQKLLMESGLDPSMVVSKWQSYYALEPQFILMRAKEILHPPESVELAIRDDVLLATGSASHFWIRESRRLAPSIAGIQSWNEEKLTDKDLKLLESEKHQIEKTVIRFQRGKSELLEGQEEEFKGLIRAVTQINKKARKLGMITQLSIRGHADSEGTEEFNMRLSTLRAERVLQALVSRGFDTRNAEAIGFGSEKPIREESTETDREWNRSASFVITFIDFQYGELP